MAISQTELRLRGIHIYQIVRTSFFCLYENVYGRIEQIGMCASTLIDIYKGNLYDNGMCRCQLRNAGGEGAKKKWPDDIGRESWDWGAQKSF